MEWNEFWKILCQGTIIVITLGLMYGGILYFAIHKKRK